MQRYFATNIDGNIVLSKDDIFHITKVMRAKKGDHFEVNDNSKVYLCEVTDLAPFSFEIISENTENHELDGFIRLLYCLPKGEKTDLVIQKSVELGVNEIVLINSERSVAKITNDKKEKKIERFNKIIKEASEQSKRSKLTKLTDVINFDEIGNYKADVNLIAYEKSALNLDEVKSLLGDIKGKSVNVIVGAEGGISEKELSIALANDYKVISLGKRILRSETACFYILSLLSFYMD